MGHEESWIEQEKLTDMVSAEVTAQPKFSEEH